MIIGEANRFHPQVHPCTPGRCARLVILCTTSAGEVLVDALPSQGGNMKLRDTGGVRPHAQQLITSAQFGMQGTLHARHSQTCRVPKRR